MYVKFAFLDGDEIVGLCEVLLDEFNRLVQEGVSVLEIPYSEDLSLFSETHYVKNKSWKVRPKAPSKFYVWDNGNETWSPDYSTAVIARKGDITAELSTRLYLPCNGFDADNVSRERISGMIARLQRGDGLPAGWIGWRDASNQQQWATDDAATVLANLTALSRAIEDREQALLVASWAHKDNIAELEDIDAIAAYDVTVGWPT